jgi:NAD-dependent dihydropyrimidine dehydrogenase PreA subunit
MIKLKKNRFPAVNELLCVKCFKCVERCPENAIVVQEATSDNGYSCEKCVKYCATMDVPCKPGTIFILYDRCNSCGACISGCDYGALYLINYKKTDLKNRVFL